jgi:hypothetical protein
MSRMVMNINNKNMKSEDADNVEMVDDHDHIDQNKTKCILTDRKYFARQHWRAKLYTP